jgi:nucleotide-binding universal stress UspA family protein
MIDCEIPLLAGGVDRAYRSSKEASMQRFQNILVYPAGLHASDAAISTATDLALRTGARLTVAWIVSREGRAPDTQRRRRAARLDGLRDQLRSWGVCADTVVLAGEDPAELLADCARERAIDLVVKTARPSDEPAARAFSGIAKELLRSSPCPVWIVRGPHDDVAPVILAAVAPYHHDGELERMDRDVLQVGAQLAELRGADLHVVSACQLLGANTMRRRVSEDEYADYLRTSELDARQSVLRFLRRNRIPSRHLHLRLGRAAQAIGSVADEIGAELVVVGAAGRTGLKRWILGNTVDDVIDASVTAVLGVRPAS